MVGTIGIMSFRVDADYKDPLASRTVPPFQVVHRWREQGQDKSHRETVTELPHRYIIRAGAEPEMVSVAYEMAATGH